MKGNPEERAIVRSAAKAFGISKSTVHKDVCSYNGGMAQEHGHHPVRFCVLACKKATYALK